MVLKSRENSVGAWAFAIGIVLAVIIGISAISFLSIDSVVKYSPQIYAVLVILGVIVGFSIKARGRDNQSFLIIGAIIVVVSKFGMEGASGSLIGIRVGELVASTFAALLALSAPATIIVAIKSLFATTRI
jgi:uncharacterized membrane protein